MLLCELIVWLAMHYNVGKFDSEQVFFEIDKHCRPQKTLFDVCPHQTVIVGLLVPELGAILSALLLTDTFTRDLLDGELWDQVAKIYILSADSILLVVCLCSITKGFSCRLMQLPITEVREMDKEHQISVWICCEVFCLVLSSSLNPTLMKCFAEYHSSNTL